ncbi:MAG TPA: PQQ-binding-like beta-propeller repeat protein [Acetobacteraceae bacterium]|nr:PQQ-binding-like beta-propeller repeat protein [Acetobacteraceae bacterium]
MAQEIGKVARRGVLLAPLALSGCGLWNHWFGENKKPIPGKREPVLTASHGLRVEANPPKVVLPPPVRNAAWPQAGGNPAHLMGHLEARAELAEAWRVGIGEGGGYRQALLAQPVVAGNLVFTMDSDGVVSALQLSDGARVWRTDSKARNDRSSNIGGGLAWSQDTLYVVNGLGEAVAFDPAKGTVRWRSSFGVPTRSAPTVVEGRIFFVTIEDRLVVLSTQDGRRLWSHEATNPLTQVLGQPAPAYANGLVVAGFGSGEIACLRADSGNVVWSDSLGGVSASATLADFSSIRGRPVISGGKLFAVGMGGLTVGMDLPTGRRLWELNAASENSPWVAGSWMFMISQDQELAAIDTANGSVAWVSALPRWKNEKEHSGLITWWGPTLLSDRLVVTGTTGEALALSPYTGAILGRQRLSSPAAPLEPVVAQGTLLVVTNAGRLLALR